MASISLSQFRQISSGTHNVGDVYINDQNKLEKVNNFVTFTARNTRVLHPEQNIAVRTALFKALSKDRRMTEQMLSEIKELLLGENAVRSLARREIVMYLAALDRGNVDGLKEKVNYFHIRSLNTALNKSLEKIVYEHTVNEKLDRARMQIYRARQSLALIGKDVSPEVQRDYSHDMRTAWNAFKDAVAAYCEQDKEGLPPESVKNELAKFDSEACFSKVQTAEEAREALKALFESSLNRVPHQFRDEARVVTDCENVSDQDINEIANALADGGRVERRTPQVRDVVDLSTEVARLEGMAAFDSFSRKELLAELASCEADIQKTLENLTGQNSNGNAEDLEAKCEICRGLLERVQANTERIKGQVAANPLSYRNVLSSVRDWTKAADAVYCGLCETYNLTERIDIRSGIHLSLSAFDDVEDLDDDCPDPGRYLKDIESKFAEQVGRLLKLQGRKVDVEKVVKPAFEKALNDVLERKDWKAIKRDLFFKIGDERVRAQCSITPALQIDGFKENLKPDKSLERPEEDEYGKEGGKNGLVCHNTTTWHANNFACSSIQIYDEKTGQMRVVYKGGRNATICPYGIKDPVKRAQACINRAREVITGCALMNDSLLDYVETNPNPPYKFSLLFTSTSLLTPDLLRNFCKSGTSKDERMMVNEQIAAWNAVDGQGLTIKVPKKDGSIVEVEVTPKVLAFNFGVNGFALLSLSPSNLFGGWDLSDKINDTALAKLRDVVSAHVQTLQEKIDAPEEGTEVADLEYRKNAIETLMAQIEAIHAAKSEHGVDHDAYKIAVRINVLTYLLGGTPDWNCKSGKDRTGELDVESKFLATLIAKKQEIPRPGAILTPEQQAIFNEIAQSGGNFELQTYNTSVGGFKVDHVGPISFISSIPERMGEALPLHMGLSRFV